jgi:T-complex protein 1 subunit eta
LVAGVAFKKTFSYAGFEMQRKQYTDPKIALLNIELELKSEKENAEVRVDSVEVSSTRIPRSPCSTSSWN